MLGSGLVWGGQSSCLSLVLEGEVVIFLELWGRLAGLDQCLRLRFDLLDLVDANLSQEMNDVHPPKDVHESLVGLGVTILREVRVLQHHAEGRQEAEDDVESEPGQVDIGILDEVVQGLRHVRNLVCLATPRTSQHAVQNVDACGQHVAVEA